MARNFAYLSEQYLINGNAVVTAVPLTMVAFVYTNDDVADDQGILQIADVSSNIIWFDIDLYYNGGSKNFRAVSIGAGNAQAISSNSYSADTWYHVGGVFTNPTSRNIYVDGISRGSNSTSSTPTGLDQTAIGMFRDDTPRAPFDGYLAEAAVYSTNLTAAEMAILAMGMSPLAVRPQNLVAYWPLYGNLSPEPDWLENKYNMTLTNGPTKADHPPVVYPVSPQIIHVPTRVDVYRELLRIKILQSEQARMISALQL